MFACFSSKRSSSERRNQYYRNTRRETGNELRSNPPNPMAFNGNAPSPPFIGCDDVCLNECVDNDIDLNNYTMVSIDDICRRNFPGKEPYFILRGINSTDVHQGGVGTCVLLSILGAVASKGQSVVAKKCEFYENVMKPNGISRQKKTVLLRNLKSISFMINDQKIDVKPTLPVTKESAADPSVDYELLGSKIQDKGNEVECWLALYEKAFAKYHNSYDEVDGGLVHKWFPEIVGLDSFKQVRLVGTCQQSKERSYLEDVPFDREIFKDTLINYSNSRKDNLIIFPAASCGFKETKYPGLCARHQYASMHIFFPPDESFEEPAILFRNPWGCRPVTAGKLNRKILKEAKRDISRLPREYRYIIKEIERKSLFDLNCKQVDMESYRSYKSDGCFVLTIPETYDIFCKLYIVELFQT